MRKLLLSVCAAAACWISDAGAMEGKTVDGKDISDIAMCRSNNGKSTMISRWELGNEDMYGCRYLHIDYSDIDEQFEREKSKANITNEMRNILYTLPESIGRLNDLRVLDVYDGRRASGKPEIRLERLPDSIGNLKNLQILDLYSNYLVTLPQSIGNLKNLRILDLSDNNLSTLPESIGNLENLEELNLDSNKLRALPDFIGNLESLRTLNLTCNDLKTLPNSIGNLKNLEELYLSSNYSFRDLPDSIGNLRDLKTLGLKMTNLRTLPESMENLTNLENLDLSRATRYRGYDREDSYSSSWKDEIIQQSLAYWSLQPLTENGGNRSSLDWSNKNLTQLPFGTYMLTNLEKLDVSNNQITKIPRLLRKQTGLKKLYLHNNPNLNHLPDFLWDMYNLEELRIDGKLVKDLPKNARISLDKRTLEDSIVDLTLAGKNNRKISDEALDKEIGPYTVYLKKN